MRGKRNVGDLFGCNFFDPHRSVFGVCLFIAADQRHAAELLAMGTMPEALALFMGLLVMVPLPVGMIFGWIFYYVRKNKSQ